MLFQLDTCPHDSLVRHPQPRADGTSVQARRRPSMIVNRPPTAEASRAALHRARVPTPRRAHPGGSEQGRPPRAPPHARAASRTPARPESSRKAGRRHKARCIRASQRESMCGERGGVGWVWCGRLGAWGWGRTERAQMCGTKNKAVRSSLGRAHDRDSNNGISIGISRPEFNEQFNTPTTQTKLNGTMVTGQVNTMCL